MQGCSSSCLRRPSAARVVAIAQHLGTSVGAATFAELVPRAELAQGEGSECIRNLEGPIRVPLWNWAPKTMYGMVFGT